MNDVLFVIDGHQDGGLWRYTPRGDANAVVLCWTTERGARNYALGAQEMLKPEYRRRFTVMETTRRELREQYEFQRCEVDDSRSPEPV
jgi:hypothetical protein